MDKNPLFNLIVNNIVLVVYFTFFHSLSIIRLLAPSLTFSLSDYLVQVQVILSEFI